MTWPHAGHGHVSYPAHCSPPLGIASTILPPSLPRHGWLVSCHALPAAVLMTICSGELLTCNQKTCRLTCWSDGETFLMTSRREARLAQSLRANLAEPVHWPGLTSLLCCALMYSLFMVFSKRFVWISLSGMSARPLPHPAVQYSLNFPQLCMLVWYLRTLTETVYDNSGHIWPHGPDRPTTTAPLAKPLCTTR